MMIAALGTGSGWANKFAAAVDLAGAPAAGLVILDSRDLDGNRLPDLLATTPTGGLYYLFNRGDGNFRVAATNYFDVPQVIADLNGDGSPDVISFNNSASFTVALAANQQNFNSAATVNLPGVPASIVVADFNKDNKADIVVYDRNNQIRFLPGNGDGTFGAPVTVLSVRDLFPGDLFTSDFNNDGRPDLLIVYSQGEAQILLGKGDGSFTSSALLIDAKLLASGVLFRDLNNDGRIDVIAPHRDRGLIQVLYGDGLGGVSASPIAVGASVASVTTADFDRDGKLDLVYSTGNSLGVARNRVNDFQVFAAGATRFRAGRLIAIDADQDGRPDLIGQTPANNGVVSNVGVSLNLRSIPRVTFRATPTVMFGEASRVIVDVVPGEDGAFGVPTGPVVITNGANTEATVNLDAAGTATLDRLFRAGSYTLNATYAGDASFTNSTLDASVSFSVAPGSTLVTLVPSTTAPVNGQPVSFAITVAAIANVVPLGRVRVDSLSLTSNQLITICEPELKDGKATCVGTFLPGPYEVTGFYSGDSSYRPSASAVVKLRPVDAVTFSASSGPSAGIAPDSLASAYLTSPLPITATVATSVPLPLQLNSVRVLITDAAGKETPAQLLFAGPTQVNFVVPKDVAPGGARIAIFQNTTQSNQGVTVINAVAPSIFTANSSGSGLAAALAIYAKADGSQTQAFVANCLPTGCTPVPIIVSDPAVTSVLQLFATGLRKAQTVTVKVGGLDAQVLYAGTQGEFLGLDQINVLLPRSLIGRGLVDVVVTADGVVANRVQVSIQ